MQGASEEAGCMKYRAFLNRTTRREDSREYTFFVSRMAFSFQSHIVSLEDVVIYERRRRFVLPCLVMFATSPH